MQVDVITLFPTIFDAITQYGITSRALHNGLWRLTTWNPRDFTTNNYRTIDDRPYGGGPGMVMMPEPLALSINAAKNHQSVSNITQPHIIYFSPQGKKLNHHKIVELSLKPGLILLCGRYEGIDERTIETQVNEEISIGDIVLSGGELPAMVLIDAILRQLPGVLHDSQSAVEDSFVDGLLDYPHYTRPEIFSGKAVPEVLLSGDHAKIARWRLKQSLGRTWQRRPDLLADRTLTKQESGLLAEYQQEQDNAIEKTE